jgi:hypothetical protein
VDKEQIEGSGFVADEFITITKDGECILTKEQMKALVVESFCEALKNNSIRHRIKELLR